MAGVAVHDMCIVVASVVAGEVEDTFWMIERTFVAAAGPATVGGTEKESETLEIVIAIASLTGVIDLIVAMMNVDRNEMIVTAR